MHRLGSITGGEVFVTINHRRMIEHMTATTARRPLFFPSVHPSIIRQLFISVYSITSTYIGQPQPCTISGSTSTKTARNRPGAYNWYKLYFFYYVSNFFLDFQLFHQIKTFLYTRTSNFSVTSIQFQSNFQS